MTRFRVSIMFSVFAIILGSFQYSALSPSDLLLGVESKSLTTIQQITQDMQAKGAKMDKENLYLIVQTVIDESLRHGIDYRLILAIMKVESNYRQYVISPDGARGFMQIAPSLASGIAKEAGIEYNGLKDLYDPQKNIRLGIYYISKLIDLFDDLPTALFAYNVGHHKAQKLLAADMNPHTFYTKRVIAEYEKNTKDMTTL